MIGVALIILTAVVLIIWFSIEFKRFKHKIWAFVLIALVVFGYISLTVSLKDQNINYRSVSGLFLATKVYFSWLFSMGSNVKTITANAIHMDWSPTTVNQTITQK